MLQGSVGVEGDGRPVAGLGVPFRNLSQGSKWDHHGHVHQALRQVTLLGANHRYQGRFLAAEL
jgi:hypothetical protein